MSQTDKFDTPPRPRIKLVEYHLTNTPTEKATSQSFVTVIRPYPSGGQPTASVEAFDEIDGGHGLKLRTLAGTATVLMQNDGGNALSWGGATSTSAISVVVENEGAEIGRFERE